MSRAPAVAVPVAEKATGPHAVARPDSAAERQAERFAEATQPSAHPNVQLGWSFGQVPVHAAGAHQARPGSQAEPIADVSLDGGGHRFDPALQSRFAGLGFDVSGVRLHTDSSAHDTARRAGADAVTAGTDIAFAPGKYDPDSAGGRHRIAHEVAHVAQNLRSPGRRVALRDGTGAVAPATTLGGLPEADRKRIQVVTTTKVVVAGLEEKFSVKGGTMTLGLPADTTVVLDATVDAKLMHGMRNIAAALTTTADVAPAPMPENTTATLELDLTKYGGIKGLYRFTFHAPPATRKSKPAKRVIVEQLGAATTVPGQTQPAEAEKGKPAPPDPIADKMKAAGIKHSLSGARLEALRAAISDVPASHLAIVSGLTFKAAPDDPNRPDDAGYYNPNSHTVTMFEKAFTASDSKFEKGRVATSFASRAIVHEIGHAVDLAALRKARATREAAIEAVNAASGTFTSKDDKAKYNAAVRAAAAAKETLLKTRSRSGSTTASTRGETEPIDVIGTSAKGAPFRKAVKKDGKDVSEYGEKDWQESYAEAYSLFLTSPDTLRALRPATYDYLDKNLPK